MSVEQPASRPGGPGLLLSPGPAGRWDSERVSCPRVLREPDGRWKMWYYGRDPGFDRRIALPTGRCGLATSADGLRWTRLDGPHCGALLPAGKSGEFDALMTGWPQVIRWDDRSWRMYYHSIDARQVYTLGWASSDDGFKGTKRGPIMGAGPKGRFDDRGVATRHIIRLDGRWTMFYEGCKDIGQGFTVGRQIGVAVSDDGLEWTRVDGPAPDGAVLPGAPAESGLWDQRLGCPGVVPMPEGGLRLYYIGSHKRVGGGELDGVQQIGLAVSGGDPLHWTRYPGWSMA